MTEKLKDAGAVIFLALFFVVIIGATVFATILEPITMLGFFAIVLLFFMLVWSLKRINR